MELKLGLLDLAKLGSLDIGNKCTATVDCQEAGTVLVDPLLGPKVKLDPSSLAVSLLLALIRRRA